MIVHTVSSLEPWRWQTFGVLRAEEDRWSLSGPAEGKTFLCALWPVIVIEQTHTQICLS